MQFYFVGPPHNYGTPCTSSIPSYYLLELLFTRVIFGGGIFAGVIIDWSYYLLELFLAEVFLLELLLTGGIIDRRHY